MDSNHSYKPSDAQLAQLNKYRKPPHWIDIDINVPLDHALWMKDAGGMSGMCTPRLMTDRDRKEAIHTPKIFVDKDGEEKEIIFVWSSKYAEQTAPTHYWSF